MYLLPIFQIVVSHCVYKQRQQGRYEDVMNCFDVQIALEQFGQQRIPQIELLLRQLPVFRFSKKIIKIP